MISTKGRYALRVMIDICTYSNNTYIPLKDIAGRQEISLKYLEQVVSLLYKGGLVVSLRGNNGGYKLAKSPEQISAGDILRTAEGTISNVACLTNSDPSFCSHYPVCSTIDFWKGFDKVVNDYVDNITLQDLATDYKTKNSLIDEYSI